MNMLSRVAALKREMCSLGFIGRKPELIMKSMYNPNEF